VTIEHRPFIRYRLDEEAEGSGDIISVRLNAEERQILNEMKSILDIKSDGKLLKLLAFAVGRNVLHDTFGEPLLKYLFKKDRSRLSDFTDIRR